MWERGNIGRLVGLPKETRGKKVEVLRCWEEGKCRDWAKGEWGWSTIVPHCPTLCTTGTEAGKCGQHISCVVYEGWGGLQEGTSLSGFSLPIFHPPTQWQSESSWSLFRGGRVGIFFCQAVADNFFCLPQTVIVQVLSGGLIVTNFIWI